MIAVAGTACPIAHGEPPDAAGPAARELRRSVEELLEADRIDAALLSAQQALRDRPDDPAVRAEFIALHLALARQMLRAEEFATADRAFATILKIAPDHSEARRLAGGLEAARKAIPRRVREARQWLRIEWFEPAFNTFRQARALRPGQGHTLTEPYLQAAIGAGDDHYICKNFHKAFYYYDAALRIETQAGSRPSASWVSRWLQSMVHAHAEDIDRMSYPPDYWKMTLRKVAAAKPLGDAGESMAATLRGLAYEDMALPRRAAVEYATVLGRQAGAATGNAVKRARQAAIGEIRREYDLGFSERRRGSWDVTDKGDWRVLETAEFRIHHRGDTTARLVADALSFHFNRLAAFFGRAPGRIRWARPCDVYLYADQKTFHKAVRRPANVWAASVLSQRGNNLVRHEIHACRQDPLLLSASLPHELAHLMIAAIADYQPMPGAINEGLALYVEPPCRHVQFARLFGKPDAPRPLSELLALRDAHPVDTAYYAECHRLVSVLLARADASTVLDRCRPPLDARRLAERFGFEGLEDLENAYIRNGK